MTRSILCRECGEAMRNKPLDPDDRAQGWKAKFLYLELRSGDFRCDLCDKELGGIACAITMFRTGEPFPNWESQYGTVLPDDTVKMSDVLVGKGKFYE